MNFVTIACVCVSTVKYHHHDCTCINKGFNPKQQVKENTNKVGSNLNSTHQNYLK